MTTQYKIKSVPKDFMIKNNEIHYIDSVSGCLFKICSINRHRLKPERRLINLQRIAILLTV